MAEDDDKDSKTEDPTGKRLDDAMERGQFAKSQDCRPWCCWCRRWERWK